MKLLNKELFSLLREIPSDIPIPTLAQQVLRTMDVNVQTKGKVVAIGPTLLISNHPGGVDDWVVLSAVRRSDFKQVALANHNDISPLLAKITFPIYRKWKTSDLILDFLADRMKSHLIKSPIEVKERNRTSIEQAAKYISQGGAVVIYPTGTGGKKPKVGSWKPGVGFLAKQISNPETMLMFAQIKDTQMKDLLRYGPAWLYKLLLPARIACLSFSKPMKLMKVINMTKNGKEITHDLENLFYKTF